MDRAITIFVFLLVLAVSALLVAPSFIDWNQYRGAIEAYAEDTIGRDVSIDGDIGFKLLPQPSLTIGKLSIANTDDASERVMLGLERLELHAALKPLIMGDIQLTDVLLVKPQIALEILAGNRTNWRFEQAGQATQPEIKLPGWLRAVARALKLDNLVIKDGTLTYLDPGRGVKQLVEHLNGNFSAATLSGPFAATGTAKLRGVDVAFEWHVGNTEYLRTVPARFVVTLAKSKSEINFRGFLKEATLFGPVGGKLIFEGPNGAAGLNDLFSLIRGGAVAMPTGVPGRALAQDFRAETDLTMDGRAVTALNLTVGLGSVRAKGQLTGRMGREPDFALTLGTGSFNLDQLLAESHAEQESVNLTKASSEIQEKLEGFLVPTNLKGTIEIKIDGVIYRAGVIQNFAVKAHAGEGKITVDSASGRLPGKGTITSSGLWEPVPGGTRYDGDFIFNADTPPVFLRWAGFDLGGIPVERLYELSADGRIRVDPGGYEVSSARLVLDGAEQQGGFSVERGKRPVFHLILQAQHLDLDTYGGLFGIGPRDAMLRKFVRGELASGSALVLELGVQELVWGGETVEGVDVAFETSDEATTVERFNITRVGGVSLKAKGSARGSLAAPDLTLDADADADTLSHLLHLVGFDATAWPLVAGRTSVKLRGGLAPHGGVVTLETKFANGQGQTIRLEGTLGLKDGAYALEVKGADASAFSLTGHAKPVDNGLVGQATIAIKADEAAQFFATYGLDYDPIAEKLGPLDIKADIELNGAVSELKSFTAIVGDVRVEASGDLDRSGERPTVKAQIALHNMSVDGFLPAESTRTVSLALETAADVAALQSEIAGTRNALARYDWLAGYDGALTVKADGLSIGSATFKALTLDAVFSKGTFTSSNVVGDIFNGALAASLTYTAADLLPELEGRVSLKGASGKAFTGWAWGLAEDKSPLEAPLDVNLEFSALGRDRASLVNTLNGEITVTGGAGVIHGLDLTAFAAGLAEANSIESYSAMVERTLSQGTTSFASLTGVMTIEDGRLFSPGKGKSRAPFLAKLTAGREADELSAGTLTVRGQIDLPLSVVSIEGDVTLDALKDAPPLKIQLTGALDHPRRRFESASLGAFMVDEFAKRADAQQKSETDRQIDAYRSGIEKLKDEPTASAPGNK